MSRLVRFSLLLLLSGTAVDGWAAERDRKDAEAQQIAPRRQDSSKAAGAPSAIEQIPAQNSASGAEGGRGINGGSSAPACETRPSLTEALTSAPSPCTQEVLEELGIPSVAGVPPIAYEPEEKIEDLPIGAKELKGIISP